MLRIHCPVCGLRDETEFTYGGDASVSRPDVNEATAKPWIDYVFMRDNPRGPHREYWHHVSACRQWIVVERDTLTHQIFTSHLARELADRADEAAA
ncbi:sarcosine oxidase subunit delta [Ensifer sp. ENS04]|uniref:sarcosine oxidase subunit delta n=1 Tax=unclassified Ensifer TaxID=2633371 RepID=UPI00177B5E57|nr:sarcosine oxidase subunit delta [Ensifer sp. ENS04]MBD9541336.1 sarcosine oxidase subunit delta [Ensifer sp. ENS04]